MCRVRREEDSSSCWWCGHLSQRVPLDGSVETQEAGKLKILLRRKSDQFQVGPDSPALYIQWSDHKWVQSVQQSPTNYFVVSGTLEIRLGEHQLNTIDETLIVKDFNVDLIVNHPNYNNPSGSSNDIALVRLAEDADLAVYTPVCLPSHQQDFTGRQSTVAGWGATSESGPLSHVLQELEGLPVVSDSQCRTAIGSVPGYSDSDISSDMLCAGGDQGRDACQGDSGGPLVVEETDSRYTLVGVVSWGIGCARNNLPGIYAEVSSKISTMSLVSLGVYLNCKYSRIHSLDRRDGQQ